MSGGKIEKFLEKMIESEKIIVRSVGESLEAIDNLAVKSALQGVSYDSLKHAMMYRSAAALLNGQRPPLDEEKFDRQRDLVQRHIQMEEELIAEVEKILPEIGDQKVSFILESILKDEKRHHKLLSRIHEFLVRSETITEEDWWDAIWKDVPGLWA